jgi:hypothetical protein
MARTAVEPRLSPTVVFPAWAVAGLAVLLLAAFGAGFLTSRSTQPGPETLAPDWVVRLVDGNFDAVNIGSAPDLAATFHEGAVLSDMKTGVQAFGVAEIVEVMLDDDGLTLVRTSDVVYHDGYATCTFRFGEEPGSAPAVATFKIDDGKISHQWVMSDEPGGFV